MTESKAVPSSALFVDLDGTLIASDLVWESLFLTLRRQPLAAFKIPFWLLRGRPYFKQQLAIRGTPTFQHLPFRTDVLDFLHQRRAAGTKLVLATASNQALAQGVVEHLGLFDDWLATDGTNNLKGAAKLQGIEKYCQQHGLDRFEYVGDARADLPIWRSAAHAYVVAPNASLRTAVARLGKPTDVLVEPRARWSPFIKALRPHQWVKNILLVLPLLLAHLLGDASKWLSLGIAFIAFSACASAIYVLNDVLDLEADRRHPRKCRRPFASGSLPLAYAPAMIVGLLGLAFVPSLALLPLDFSGLLLLYFILNLAYSFWLKRKPMIDVLLLASMYSLRLLAGGAVVEVVVSEWLLAFSSFLFISLAFAKRYSELSRLAASQETVAAGRGYQVTDLSLIESMGPSSGYIAVLVLALYANSEPVRELYQVRWPLWIVCGLLMYWISRLWFLAKRGLLTEDPVVFSITDRVSLIVGILALLLLGVAAWG